MLLYIDHMTGNLGCVGEANHLITRKILGSVLVQWGNVYMYNVLKIQGFI